MSFIAAAASILVMGAQNVPPKTDFPNIESLVIRPSATDKAIKVADENHTLYWPKGAKVREELVVFIPGTNGNGTGAVTYCRAIASFGHRVLNLTYPSDIPAAIVRNQPDRNAFLNFRLEIIEGGDKSDAIEVDRTNSIENRLIKALDYLGRTQPKDNWGRYLTSAGQINWEKVIVAGHSQGAGHAALIGTRHKVARVVMTGGPRDYDRSADAPAAWYGNSVTPVSRFFTFNHQQDQQGCSFEELLKNVRKMGLDQVGAPVDIDKVASPYQGSHILTTNYPVPQINSLRAHVSVIHDTLTPRDKAGKLLFLPVWEYMFTSPLES